MATARVPVRDKAAAEELVERFGKLIDEAEKNMTVREFDHAAKKSGAALDRAIARRKPRSESA